MANFWRAGFCGTDHEGITWLHRGLLAVDLVLVWTLWPGYRSGWGVRLWPDATSKLGLTALLSAVVLAYAVIGATLPDERMYLAYLATYHDSGRKPAWYNAIARVNTLNLPGEDLIDDAKLAHIIEKNEGSAGATRWVATLPLAGRDLTGAAWSLLIFVVLIFPARFSIVPN